MVGALILGLVVAAAVYEHDKRKTADLEFDLRCGAELSPEQWEKANAWGEAMAKAIVADFEARQHQKEMSQRRGNNRANAGEVENKYLAALKAKSKKWNDFATKEL